MKAIRFALPVLVLLPALTFGASKEMIELQRDVAQLQESMRVLQQSFDSKMAQIQVLVQQSLDASNKSNNSVADISRSIQSSGASIGKEVQQPIANMGQRIDGMAQDLQSVQQQVADQNSKLSQLQQQLNDIKTLLSTMQAPAVPPPSAAGGPPTGGPGMTDTGAPPLPAVQLWTNARHDLDGKNDDLAISEFQQYLKYYRSTDLAPNAQYNIGEIHYRQGKMEEAMKDFDQVLEAFPVNAKTPDAHYMKGRALVTLNRRNEAVREFQAVLSQFPSSPIAPNCRAALKTLGMNPPAPVTRRRG
jgi:TolA-binding protein